jgi:probable F420-dependent oxidoreductase
MADHRPFRFAVQSFSAPSGAEWRDRARKVEGLGYSALHLADHFLGPGPALDATHHPLQELAAVPAMAAAAAATETLRIGCRVFCIDYRLPIVLAKEAATLDLLSDGRLELGLGAGWLQGEYEAANIGFDRPGLRITRLAQVVSALKAFFAGEPLEIESDAVRWSGFSGSPRPVQRPHPPIMIGGGGRRVLELAAREADIVSLNFNNRSGVIGPDGVQSSTAEHTAEKIRWIREAAGGRDIELEVGAYFTFVTPNPKPMLEGMSKGLGLSPEEMARHPHALFGEPDAIVDELQRRREAYGISYVTIGDTALDAFAPVVAKLSGS